MGRSPAVNRNSFCFITQKTRILQTNLDLWIHLLWSEVMTKACSFIKSYSLKPWTLHQKRSVLIQLEQKTHLFRPITGHFACKKYQFCKFLLKFIFPCAILNRNMGWCACSLNVEIFYHSRYALSSLFLFLMPEFSGFFHFLMVSFWNHVSLVLLIPISEVLSLFRHVWQLIFCRNFNLTKTNHILPQIFIKYFLFPSFQKPQLCELFLHFF